MGKVELDIDNKSFYDLPSINPTNTDNPSDGPVSGIPGREHKGGSGFTAMKKVISGNTKISPTPENDPRSWNMGGDGNWWSPQNHKLGGSDPIND